jgi:hypothetical protein
MIKNIKILKLSFFKNTSTEGGALKEAIKHKQPNEIIIHSQTKKMVDVGHQQLQKTFYKFYTKIMVYMKS